MTAKTTQSGPPFGPSALARHWTTNGWPCTRQYADKCIRAGCPTDSLEGSLVWRTARTGRRKPEVGGRPGGATESGETMPPRADAVIEILGDSLDALLARARQTEREQYRTYLAFVQANDLGGQNMALKNHNAAQKNLIEVEALIFEAKKERGEYVNLPEAQKRIDARLNRLRAALPSYPAKLALELFPESPSRAQSRIEKLQAEHFNAPIAQAEKPLIESPSVLTSPDPAPASVAA